MLIDTHAHLDDARFDGDRDAMIARAREAGVDTFVTIGCDLATSRAAVANSRPDSARTRATIAAVSSTAPPPAMPPSSEARPWP